MSCKRKKLFTIVFLWLGPTSSSIVITFNSLSFIDYHNEDTLIYPYRLSVRFRTIGKISNGVLLSLTHRKSQTAITPFIIIDHTNGKIEITIFQLDERRVLSTVTVSRNLGRFWLYFVNHQGFVHASIKYCLVSFSSMSL